MDDPASAANPLPEVIQNPLHESLPGWLQNSFKPDAAIVPSDVFVILITSFVLGCVVAGIYRLVYGKPRGQAVGLMASLVMLTVLISLVMMVIGNNVARAFSLAGVLAIVRFRTVVEDTRDSGFVIFAVAVGMAVGAGYPTMALMAIPFAAGAAALFRPRSTAYIGTREWLLIVRISIGSSPEKLLAEAFHTHLESSRLTATGTARQGAALDLTYDARLRREGDALALVTKLNGVEGIQNVELRAI